MQIRFFSLLLLTALLGGCGSSFQDTPSGMSGGSSAWTAPDPALRAVELQALLDEAVAKGETAEQLLQRLPSLLTQVDADALADVLTRSTFAARVGAIAGLENA